MNAQTYIKSGWGFTVGQDFARATVDTPVDLSPKEYAKAGHVIGHRILTLIADCALWLVIVALFAVVAIGVYEPGYNR